MIIAFFAVTIFLAELKVYTVVTLTRGKRSKRGTLGLKATLLLKEYIKAHNHYDDRNRGYRKRNTISKAIGADWLLVAYITVPSKKPGLPGIMRTDM